MLDHHPELAFFSEFGFAVDLVTDQGDWPPPADYAHYLAGNRIFQDSGFTVDPRLDYPEQVRDFLRQKRERDGKPRVGATVHVHFDRLARIWPRARYIHLVRDPRDVGRSCIQMGWAGNMYRGVEPWVRAETLWDQVKGSVPPDRRTEVRYEDLVREPVETLGRICQLLGLNYHPAMLRYPEDSTYGSPEATFAEKWRKALSPTQLRLAESQAGPLLAARGYEPASAGRGAVSGLEAGFWRWHDRAVRLRFRRARFGTRLFASEFALRAAAPAIQALLRWEAEVNRRLHNCERKYLK